MTSSMREMRTGPAAPGKVEVARDWRELRELRVGRTPRKEIDNGGCAATRNAAHTNPPTAKRQDDGACVGDGVDQARAIFMRGQWARCAVRAACCALLVVR